MNVKVKLQQILFLKSAHRFLGSSKRFQMAAMIGGGQIKRPSAL